MNQSTIQLQSWGTPSPPATAATPELDQLLQDYMALNAEALDLLAALYEAAETGTGVPPQMASFVPKLTDWEDRLFNVLDRLATTAEQLEGQRMPAVA